MDIITKSQLRGVRNTFEKAKGYSILSEFVNESKIRKSAPNEMTIFLSHKHDESEELKDAIALLKKHGVNVYIDHNDEDMPAHTSGTTADKIKRKIKENRKFVFLATDKAIASKWCNWELGFGDAHKYISNIAILALKEDSTNWTGNEYLQIYPIISRKYSWSDEYYEVEYPDGKKVDLAMWINS